MRTNFATLEMIAERQETTMAIRLRKTGAQSTTSKRDVGEVSTPAAVAASPTLLNASHHDTDGRSGGQPRTGRGRYRKR